MGKNRVLRAFAHALAGPWTSRRFFSSAVLDQLEKTVTDGERTHSAEVRIVVEHSLSVMTILRGNTSARQRATDVFSKLRVWDTEANNGILIYLLLADHCVEVLADRGAFGRLPKDTWANVCTSVETGFRDGQVQQGVSQALAQLNRELAEVYPATDEANPDELPNRPVLI